jgi:hypothetical protein
MNIKGKLNFAALVGKLMGNPTRGKDFSEYTLDEEASVKWTYYEEAQDKALAVLMELETGVSPETQLKLKDFKLPLERGEYDEFIMTFSSYLRAKQKARQKIKR